MGYECGDHVLDTDGAHWVPAINCGGAMVVESSAVADAGHGAPRGPRGPETDAEAAYDVSPYPETRAGWESYDTNERLRWMGRTSHEAWTPPDGWREISDAPFVIREPRGQ